MAATLTIDRTNLALAALVIGDDTTSGYTLDPSFSMGSVTWRKEVDVAKNVAGRTMTDYTRDVSQAAGSITCYGSNEADLQSKIAVLITALTQVDATLGFQKFTMTYTHGSGLTEAIYEWTCTEMADIIPGTASGDLDDKEMAVFVQAFQFTIVRDPIPLAGPI